jgi:hypothetical protein
MSVKSDLFPLVIDHAYIWVSKGAPALDELRRIGLIPKNDVNIHEGQGTASEVILFKNMYLELLWIENEPELEAYLAAGGDAIPVRETWKETGESPFGVGLHYRTPDADQLPIETLHHQAQWMPEDTYIQVVPRKSLYLPSFFILHGSKLAYLDDRSPEGGHELGVEHLTGLRITATTLENPDALSPYLAEQYSIIVMQGDYPLMELTFDNQRQGKTLDMRPLLPLIIHC